MDRKKEWICLLSGFFGALLGLLGVLFFNRYILMSLPLGPRMVSMIVVYWLIALIPIIVALVYQNKPADYGFTVDKIGLQIVTGILIGVVMSLVLTLIPHLFGAGAYVDNGKRYRFLWKFAFDFCYYIFAIGFVEEFVFRGFLYVQIKRISQKDVTAIVGSSVLFGVFHLFGGNIIQMVMTACIGILFCFCRVKIKNCSILSLIIAHGIYDALITVWASLLLPH